jgi:heme/copper-type cytochrome/quinol oxidase subunit 2
MTLTIMKTAIIIIVGIILLTFLIVSFTKNKKKTDKPFTINNQPVTASITGQTFVDTLTSLGYFKYTDTKNLGTLKKEIERVFDKVKVLTTISEEKNHFNVIATDFIVVMAKHYLNLVALKII